MSIFFFALMVAEKFIESAHQSHRHQFIIILHGIFLSVVPYAWTILFSCNLCPAKIKIQPFLYRNSKCPFPSIAWRGSMLSVIGYVLRSCGECLHQFNPKFITVWPLEFFLSQIEISRMLSYFLIQFPEQFSKYMSSEWVIIAAEKPPETLENCLQRIPLSDILFHFYFFFIFRWQSRVKETKHI